MTMGVDYITISQLPPEFMDELMREFRPYTVALSRIRNNDAKTFRALGAGVFVTKGKRFGILTAHHCLHACQPEVVLGPGGIDTLILQLQRGPISIGPNDAFEHVLARPVSDEFGPDLVFVEIFGDKRATILRSVSAWPLEENHAVLARTLATPTNLTCLIGFPALDSVTSIEPKAVHQDLKHMTFIAAIEAAGVFEKDGWDYIDTTCDYSGKDALPSTFGGVSGGPIWGVRARKDKVSGRLSIDASALIGVVFYEGPKVKERRKIRGHCVHSIYVKGWINLPH